MQNLNNHNKFLQDISTKNAGFLKSHNEFLKMDGGPCVLFVFGNKVMEQPYMRVGLDKLGFPGYEVDTLGNVFGSIFNKAGLTPKEVSEIRLKHASGQYQKDLAVEYRVIHTTIRRVTRLSNGDDWKKLKPNKKRNGYLQVIIAANRKRYSKTIHRLVLEAFVGPCPDKHEAAHNDGNRENNTLGNLRWATKKDNAHDRLIHGNLACCEKSPLAKLTANTVLKIRENFENGMTRILISKIHKVRYGTVCEIITRNRWKHL